MPCTDVQRLDVKAAAAVGKLQRTDTQNNTDERPAADAGHQDSVQTAFFASQHLQQQHQHAEQQEQCSHPAMVQQQHCHQQAQQQLTGMEEMDGSSSEVEGPVADDKYIKGTRLIINGWFQACR